MGFIDSIKEFFTGPPKRMSGASVVIKVSKSHINLCHEIELVAARFKLLGRLSLTSENTVSAELEGAHDALKELIHQLESGKILPPPISVEMMWLPYKKQYTGLQVKVFHDLNIPAKPRTPPQK